MHRYWTAWKSGHQNKASVRFAAVMVAELLELGFQLVWDPPNLQIMLVLTTFYFPIRTIGGRKKNRYSNENILVEFNQSFYSDRSLKPKTLRWNIKKVYSQN